jgi:uncharacterized protein (DUF362 family)/Pyruvate/2-oxoacid:ferredoxin oxidoreductase delta subunit
MHSHPTVALVKCRDYGPGLVDAVDRLLALAGGIEKFVKPGHTVLLKPNLLTDRTPEQAVTTHPELVRVIVRILKKLGANPFVADSPSNVTKVERVWEKTGFQAMCSEEDIPLVNLEKAGSVRFGTNDLSFNVARPVLDADVIINVPKVKTHVLTVFTGGVKNMYGVVPGFQKAHLHKLNPTVKVFGRLVAEIYSKVPPALTVADAIVGMDGDGPSAGRPVKLGFLAASEYAVALDVVLCRILGIELEAVSYMAHLTNAGHKHVVTSGDNIESIAVNKFRAPSTLLARLIPGLLVRLLQPFLWIRPSFSDNCVSCGRCIKICAAGALILNTETADKAGTHEGMDSRNKPIINASKCIGCCCCHEVCPEKAVSMTQSPLLNFIRRGKKP